MKVLLFVVFLATSAAGQSLTLSSTDGRCSGSSLTCVFTNRETLPADYGIPITASGTGTWTLGGQTPTTCSYRLFSVYDRNGAAITTITPPTTFYIQPLYADASACLPGAYAHTLPFTNGATTVNLTASLTIVFRRAAPIAFNGYNVADSALSTHGWSQGTSAFPATFSYNLNQQSCSNCNPGQSPAWQPPAAGSVFTDELGNAMRVITPPTYTHQNSEKAAANLDNSYIMTSDPNGNYSIWDTAGHHAFPSLNTNTDFGGQGTYCWSSTNANVVYSIITDSTFKSAQTGTFKKITLSTPPAYTNQTGSGETAGVWWVFPPSLGRVLSNTISHGDCDSANHMPVGTIKEFQTTVDITGTTVTATSGDAFDNHLLDQPWPTGSGVKISAVTDSTHLTLSSAPGDQTAYAMHITTMWNICVVDLEAAGAQGASYAPVCSDVSTMPRPLINYVANPGIYLSNGTDAVSGKSYVYLGNFPYDVIGAWTPGVDTSLTLYRSFLELGDPYSTTCDDGAASNSPSASHAYRCLAASHGDVFHTADGSQWIAAIPDGASWEIFRLRDIVNAPKVYEAGGGYSIAQYTNYVAGEAGSARLAPYWAISLDNDALLPGPTSQAVNTCTNTNPAVLQLAQTPDYTNGTSILVNGVQGNTACNGVHTAVTVSGNNVTLEVNGNGAPVANTGAVTKNVTFAGNDQPDADQATMFRDIGIESHRVGHLRSVLYPNDHIVGSFWAQPRMAPCMDGSCAIFTTNFGLPENYQVVMVTFPNSGGALQTNQFDQTHSVLPSVTATSVTFNYSTPDTGNVVLEIGQSLRLTDGAVAADPSGVCPTVNQAVLSLASNRVFTCSSTLAWTQSAPDPSYQAAINSSGGNPRSNTFTGLTSGVTYFYRVTANHKTLAYGSFVPGLAIPPTGTTVSGATVGGEALVH